MTNMRLFVISIILLMMVLIAYGYLKGNISFINQEEQVIGGSFSLINQDGETVSNKNMLGKYTLVFFGFSRCSSICPTQLSTISAIIEEINSKKLQAFFITIDPVHDTVEQLKLFHERFDPRIQMLTGEKDKIDEVINSYKVYASFSENPEEMNHSTLLYIMDRDGKFLDLLNIASYNLDDAINYVKTTIK